MIMMLNQEQISSNKLIRIIKELNVYKNKDKADLMLDYIQKRLNKSLNNYYSELRTLYDQYNNLDHISINKLKKEL